MLKMASPYRHPQTGIFWLRKRVPSDLVEVVGKREVKLSLRTRDPSEAKTRAAAMLVELDNRWQTLARGVLHLSERDADRYAEEVAQRFFELHQDNPSLQTDWDTEIGETLWVEDVFDWENITKQLDKIPDHKIIRRMEMRQFSTDIANELADRRGLNISEATYPIFVKAISKALQISSKALLKDEPFHSKPRLHLNRNEYKIPTGSPTVTMQDIYNAWALEARATTRTLDSFRRVVAALVDHLGHDRAQDVKMKDIVAWKTAMLSAGLQSKTIKDGKLAPMRAIFQRAVADGVLQTNPFVGVSIDARVRPGQEKRGFNDAEARLILSEALKKEGALKWIPLLTATTGARVSEISQLRRGDVYQVDNFLCIKITADAGSLKNKYSAREIPVHSALLEIGFLEYISKISGNLPLFPDVKPDRYGNRGGTATRKISKVVRALGIHDLRVSPNHAWRHRFATLMRRHRVDENVRNVLSGHAQNSVAANYGTFEVEYLKSELEKIPRESIGLQSRPKRTTGSDTA